MPKRSAQPKEWDRVLVRHVMAARRDNIDRLSSLLHVPFEDTSQSSASGEPGDLQYLGRPSGRWMVAANLSGQDWTALFTNVGESEELFEENAKNKRLEVAWIGFREDQGGWFLRLRRGSESVADFSQGHDKGSEPTCKAADLPEDFLKGSAGGAKSFERLCGEFGLSPKQREIHAEKKSFVQIGLSGKPVKTGLRGCLLYAGAQIADGESRVAGRLEKAIEQRDEAGIRKAVAAGASLEHLPDNSISPLLSALYQCPADGWEQCAEALIELGAPIDGFPDGEPPIVSATMSFVEENISLAIVKFLVQQGADPNAQGERGETALYSPVVHHRKAVIQFLMEHGADPHAKGPGDKTVVEWVRWRIGEDHELSGYSEFAEILTLLTGEEVEQPALATFTEELKLENERFQEALMARNLLKIFSEEAKFEAIPTEMLTTAKSYQATAKALSELGFQSAGTFALQQGFALTFAEGFVNEADGFDAMLTPSEQQLGGLRLEIGAEFEDGRVISVATEADPPLLSFKSSLYDCETLVGASVSKLTKHLKKKLESKGLETTPLKLKTFRERTERHYLQLTSEIREYLTKLLETPVCLVDGRPARFERLGCYLDIVSENNPTWSTAIIAEDSMKDLQEADAEESNDTWKLQRVIHDAADLLVMKRLEFAGAPAGDAFLTLGSAVAVRFFETESRRSKPFSDFWYADELLQGLLLSMLSDRWDDVARIAKAVKLSLATSKARMSDDAPRELAKFLLVLASRFRPKAIQGQSKLISDIKKSRQKHAKLLLKAWEAIQAQDQAGYEKHLEESLMQLREDYPQATSFYELRRFLAWPESILILMAEKEGLSRPQLPEPLEDRLLV